MCAPRAIQVLALGTLALESTHATVDKLLAQQRAHEITSLIYASALSLACLPGIQGRSIPGHALNSLGTGPQLKANASLPPSAMWKLK